MREIVKAKRVIYSSHCIYIINIIIQGYFNIEDFVLCVLSKECPLSEVSLQLHCIIMNVAILIMALSYYDYNSNACILAIINSIIHLIT